MLKVLKNIEQIKQELEQNGELLLEYDFDAFNEEYFNELVRELSNFHVSEIRPYRIITIKRGINSEILKSHLNQLIEHVISYTALRNEVFNDFISSLDLDSVEGQYYKLREKLQSTNNWPRGKFRQWNYWAHGSDIEFDNVENGSHFNVAMSNFNSIKYWSIHRYIKESKGKSKASKYIIEHKNDIPKMFDLLVLQKRMKSIRTPFYEKQYKLVINGKQK